MDDLYPTDSSVLNLDPPEEQVIEIQQDKTAILAAAPVLDSIIQWFDEEIKLCDSIDGLDVESSVELKVQIIARQALKAKLEAARDSLISRKDSFIPNYKL